MDYQVRLRKRPNCDAAKMILDFFATTASLLWRKNVTYFTRPVPLHYSHAISCSLQHVLQADTVTRYYFMHILVIKMSSAQLLTVRTGDKHCFSAPCGRLSDSGSPQHRWDKSRRRSESGVHVGTMMTHRQATLFMQIVAFSFTATCLRAVTRRRVWWRMSHRHTWWLWASWK